MCYQWETQEHEVSPEEWQEILKVREDDIKSSRYGLVIVGFVLLISLWTAVKPSLNILLGR